MTWTQRGSVLEASDAADNDGFGISCSLSSTGEKLVVGTLSRASGGSNRGGVYTYTRNGTSWTQVGSAFTPSDVADADFFGGNVCLSADGLVLAASSYGWEGASGTNRGGVYIFDWNSGTSSWDQRGSVLEASDAADDDQFGRSVWLSVNGEVLAVGAQLWEGASGTNRGGVYIFDRNGSSWTQRGSVLEGTNDSDQYGRDISLSEDGEVLVVGAQGYSTSTGAVYTYDRNGSSWTQRGSILQADDATTNYGFGSGVAISDDGNVLAVGSFLKDVGGTDRGGVYIYDRSGSTWTKRGSTLLPGDIADGDKYGTDVGFSHRANVLAVGAYQWEGAAGTNRGGVYIYDSSDKILGITNQTYIQTNNAVNLQYGRKIIVDATAYSLTLSDVILTPGDVGIVIDVTSYAATANNVNLLYGRNQIIDVTSFTQTNNDINLIHGYQLLLSATPFTLTNQDVGLLASRKIAIGATNYSLTLNDLLFSHGYNLVIDPTTFTLTNSNLNLLAGRKITLDTIPYSLTNNDIFFSRGYIFPIDLTNYSVVANDISLLATRILGIDVTSCILNNSNVNLTYRRILPIGSTTFSLTNNDINLLAGRKLGVAVTNYSITNNDIQFLYNRIFNISSGSYTLTTNDLNLLFGRGIGISPSSFTLTLNDLEVLKGSKIIIGNTSYSVDSSLSLLYDRIFHIDSQSYVLTLNDLYTIYGYSSVSPITLIALSSTPKTIYSNNTPKIIIGN